MKTTVRESLNGTINRKLTSNTLNTQIGPNLNASINLGNNVSAIFDHKTFIKIYYADNKIILLNSLCSCLHMLNHLKEQLNLSKDESIDLMDFDGNLKEIPNTNNKDYAIQFLTPTASYAILKIEMDANTNEKRYNPLLNENRLTTNMTKSLTNLNTGKNLTAKDKLKLTREQRLKQQQQLSQQPQAQQQLPVVQQQNSNTTSTLQQSVNNSSSSGNLQSLISTNTNTNTTNAAPATNLGRKSSKQLK